MNEEAALRFTKLFFQANTRFGDLLSFRKTARRTLPHVKDRIGRTTSALAQVTANSKQFDKLFTDKQGFFDVIGGPEAMAKQMADREIRSYETLLDEWCIVCAHSILDAAACDCFSIADILAPLDAWEFLIGKKTVELSEVKNKGYETLAREKIQLAIKNLERESLLKRIDTLFCLCKPPDHFSPIRDYTYNRGKVEELDTLRQDIMHGEGFVAPLKECNDDMVYMRNTMNFLFVLLNYGFGVKLSGTHWKESMKGKKDPNN